jgi:hypothetical protein
MDVPFYQLLYDPAGSVYNVDGVLAEMVSGLEVVLTSR